jgi:peptidoglycan hydrolase-like protein with peptidoglycan-binding domain
MQSTHPAPRARVGPLAIALAVLGLVAVPVSANAARSHAREAVAMTSAGWHGRAIHNPRPRPRLVRMSWPKGWSAGSVGLGTGYLRPGGSDRVREVQRRLLQLGYHPGPADGLFGPRTRAATRWFQFKHGLVVSGRATRSTLAVLQARSDHKPLPTAERGARNGRSTAVAPLPKLQAPAVPDEGSSITWVLAGLLILLALALGVLVSSLLPELPRIWRTPASPPADATVPRPAPAPVPVAPPIRQAPARAARRVLGYATVDGDDDAADTATAAIALRCAHRGWSLTEVLHDRRQPGRGLAERPGLMHAVKAIRSGAANGLVVARMREFTTRIADLAMLLTWLHEVDAFLGAADHELDTSTREGRGTAGAIIALGRWERERIIHRTGEDLTLGRFTPVGRPTMADLANQIVVMRERGLSLRAIAEALNVAGIPGPQGHARWQTTDVKATTEERSRTY